MRVVFYAAILMIAVSLLLMPTPPPVAAHQPSSQPQALSRDMMGMVIRDPWYDFGTYPGMPNQPNRVAQDRMGQVLAEAGVQWVRLEFFVLGDGTDALNQTFARYDYFINTVAPRHNFKVLALVGFGIVNEHDILNTTTGITAGPFVDDPQYGGGVNPYIKRWLTRSLAIANRYGDKIAVYEVLNEQNRLPPSGKAVPAYLAARLHTKFFHHLKFPTPSDGAAWRRSVKVIIGGLHPKGTLEKGQPDYLSDTDYLRQLYGYNLATGQIIPTDPFPAYNSRYDMLPLDGIGYHPYPEEIRLSLQADVDLITDRLNTLRNVLASMGDPYRPFWITEIGYNTAFKAQTEAGQAAFMRTVYTTLAARPDIASIFWFKYEDFPPADGPNAQRWGIVRINFTNDSTCPGGACYTVSGEPAYYRQSFWVYRELAGLPIYRVYLPLVARS